MDIKILDVGGACGAIAEGIRKAGADVTMIDLNEYMIGIARMQFPEVKSYVCDAVNMHLFGDNAFDVIHSNQVAEHWKPELVKYILQEFYRVLKPGGKIFQVMDTLESFKREGRDGTTEDPTHICIWSLSTWHQMYSKQGFIRCVSQQPLFRGYKWDHITYMKP